MGRSPRHLGARSVAEDQSKVLGLMPVFPGESIERMRVDGYAVGLSDTDVTNPIIVEWVGLAIPYPIVMLADELASGAQADLSTVADWDQLFHQFTLSADEGGTEFYGGDVDVDPEEGTRDDLGVGEDALLETGPVGPYIFHREANICRPFAAAGNDTIRFGDEFRTMIGPERFKKASWGQILIFGMVRYKSTTVEGNFNIEKDDAASIKGLARLMSGDYTRVANQIASDTGVQGDWLRTVLFGGDNFIEASTLVGTTVKAYALMDPHISGPLSRKMNQ